jgi:uncharacterized protein (DUF58 family)
MTPEQYKAEFLDMNLFAKLPNLELKARFLVSGFLAGLHKTPYRGSSVEFKEYRDYQQGDELKMIDWKAYARSDRLQIKLREEETNMTVNIILDSTESMNFKSKAASMTKWNYARAIAAAFLLFLKKQKDAVALGFADDTLNNFSKPSASSYNIHRLMASLHGKAESKNSNLPNALYELIHTVRRRSIVIILSDCYTNPEDLKNPIAFLRYMNCEVLLFHILDPSEISFSYTDNILLSELETGNRITLSPELIKKEYNEAIQNHIKALISVCGQHNAEYELLNTSQSPIHALGAYLSKRKMMK